MHRAPDSVTSTEPRYDAPLPRLCVHSLNGFRKADVRETQSKRRKKSGRHAEEQERALASITGAASAFSARLLEPNDGSARGVSLGEAHEPQAARARVD